MYFLKFLLNFALQRNPKGNPAEIQQNPAKKIFFAKMKKYDFLLEICKFRSDTPPRETFELFKSERNKL